ncbi:metallophosphoesterase [Leucobacter sp. GX24907]
MPTRSRRAAAVLGAAATGVAVYSTFVEPRLFTVRRATIPVLPAGASPVRVLQISDTHLAPWQRGKIDWVRSLAALKPDLVVLTGDLMGHTEARAALVTALIPFSEVGCPVVFVHGSNDYYGPKLKNPLKYLRSPSRLGTKAPNIDNEALTRSFTEGLGFVDLNNSATSLRVRDTEFELFGLNDPHISRDDDDAMRAALATVRQGSSAAGSSWSSEPSSSEPSASPTVNPAVPGPVRLGVVHAPYQSALGTLLDAGADLILAGHTHGGQVRLPGIGALTANCDLPTAQARGLSVWYDAHRACYLNVSAGIGGSIYTPMRLCCRPEASLITLEAA